MHSNHPIDTPVSSQQQNFRKSDVTRWLERARSSHNYFTFFTPFFRIMSKLDALFIQHLINLSAVSKRDKDGWFLCTSSYLGEKGWTENEVDQRLKSLKGGDSRRPTIIRTKVKGSPPQRWVWIDMEAIERALDEVESDDPITENHGINSGVNTESIPGQNGPTKKEDSELRSESEPRGKTPFHATHENGSSPSSVDNTSTTNGSSSAMEEMFPRIPSTKDKKPRCETTQFDDELAKSIRQWAIDHKKVPRRTQDVWAPALAVLRRRLEKIGHKEDYILRVWNWYRENYKPGDKSLPLVTTGKELADRWDWITDRMERETINRPTQAPDKLSPETAYILNQLMNYIWPKGAEGQLPAVVEQSVQNYKSFQTRLKDKSVPGCDWHHNVILDTMEEIHHYLEKWFSNVWKAKHDWDGWNGDMGPHVWRPDHKDFVRLVTDEIRRQSGRDDVEVSRELFVTDTKRSKDGTPN